MDFAVLKYSLEKALPLQLLGWIMDIDFLISQSAHKWLYYRVESMNLSVQEF